MRITSPKLHTAHLTPNEEALVRCQTALELKDKGDYDGVREVLRPIWKNVGERPNTNGLHASVAAEVLLSVGILTCWLGSKSQIKQAQEIAKDIIGESINFFESIRDIKKVAAARAELAYCYWCEGALDEARIMFVQSLEKLTAEGNTRARALLGLAVVEWSASRFGEALRILTDNASLFQRIHNHTTKGTYHNQLAILLTNLATIEKRPEYFQWAIREHEEADEHFRVARNPAFRANVKNNLGFLLHKLCQFPQAHEQLEQARRLMMTVRDKIAVAQIDDTRAQVFLAENKVEQAEAVSKGAVKVLEKSGQQCLLADALITHGIALARSKQIERAQFTFQKAVAVAHQVGALNKAGLAALSLIEELQDISSETLYAAYHRASDWLSSSQSPDLLLRLNAAARKIFLKLRGELNSEDATQAIVNTTCDLPQEVLKFEAALIRRALAQANGSVTRASSLLSMSYQALGYVIESRHKDLLKDRSPIRRRSRRETERQQDSVNS